MAIEISEAPRVAGTPAEARDLASIIDHTLLKAEASTTDIERLCREAVEHGFACVMVNPTNIGLAAYLLSGTRVNVGSVIGFPLGATTTPVKRFEALEAIRLGAREIDMVMNVGALKSGDRARVQSDMRALVETAHAYGALLKITIEIGVLSLEEKILACQLVLASGADYIKSSTGFQHPGAATADISLMRGVMGEKLGVKASGGIRTLHDAQKMIEAGASRIGTSSGVAILTEVQNKSV